MCEKIVECVPNISEGRDPYIVAQCVNAVASVDGVKVLNYSSDYDHNRSVITFIGSPDGVIEAAVKLCEKACELIDLTKHQGEHPRMGAVDVCPFIPIKNISMNEVIEISKTAGRSIYEKTGIPVYMYEKSASSPERENLANVRKGQFEGLSEKTQDSMWQPDFGTGYHKTAGITIVGAREFLIAFNIELDTSDVEIAKKIAKTIRFSNGGYPCVKALGLMLHETNTAQVSINFTDYKTTSLFTVVERVRSEAEKYGTKVKCTELIGLSPMKALIDCAEYYLNIKNFDYENQVFENHLLSF